MPTPIPPTPPHPFSADAIAASVHATMDDALRAIPMGKRGAFLVDATGGTVRAVLAARIGDNWQAAAGVDYDGHQAAGRVALIGSW
jgi:hypothetical protein